MNHPEPHQRYLVGRGSHYFIATPCYGLHEPWWVPSTPTGESEPIPMQDTDWWVPLAEILRKV